MRRRPRRHHRHVHVQPDEGGRHALSPTRTATTASPPPTTALAPAKAKQPLIPIVTIYYYDEWDFRAQDYKPRWCAVKESKLEEGEEDFYDNTLREHAGLVAQTRKQFELMKPEIFRKIKRLPDGEDFDLDAAIEWMVETRAGASPNEKIYWRRNKIERDVAVAFLIDMSASTDEEINKRDKQLRRRRLRRRPAQVPQLVGLQAPPGAQRAAQADHRPRERVDRPADDGPRRPSATSTASTASAATDATTSSSSSSRTSTRRSNDEDQEPARQDHADPLDAHGAGHPARHLQAHADRRQGEDPLPPQRRPPQDHGYGRDRTEKEYAIHDTKQALNEAKREGITPFALTVDRAGHDYLKTMCDDMGYEVVADIEALPSRLPTLYRRLTE